MSAILLLINLKGGVAKTTNAVAIAECLASNGYRTLLIDADHQCMASELLLGEDRLFRADLRKSTLHDLLAAMLHDEFDSSLFAQYVVSGASNISGTETLSVLPCSVRIDDFQTNMAKAKRGHRSNDEFLDLFSRRRQQMRRWLQSNYDFTVIDCPPSLALQVKVFLSVADGFIVPSVPDRLSVRGSLSLIERLGRLPYKITQVGTLWSLYREQNHVHRDIVKKSWSGAEPFSRLPPPFDTVIPNATAIADSADPEKTPATFRAKYTPQFSKLFEQLCGEIISRTQWAKLDKRPAPAETVGTI